MKKIADAVAKIVIVVENFTPEERSRTMNAVLAVFSDSPVRSKNIEAEEPSINGSALPASARQWMKKYSITEETLAEVFDIDGGRVTVIGEVPGRNQKAKTLNAYVVEGIRSLLSSGSPNFDDKDARELCKKEGCYDDSNHASYLKDLGSDVTGSRQGGWKVTTPGLKRGAELIREMVTN